MGPERLILCGGAGAHGRRPANAVELRIYDPDPNINFKIERLRRALWTGIPSVLRDLLDVAIYVYVADQTVPRGNGGRLDRTEIGEGWRRSLRFRIPVRERDLWSAEPVRGALESVLGFLSEDAFTFEFEHLTNDPPLEDRLAYSTTPFTGTVQEVVLFSGGLDSLAGAITESIVEQKQVLLVNHRSTEKITPIHEGLVRELEKRAAPFAPLHTPVWVNKAKELGRESTQRTRSFLFAAFGAVFARMIGLTKFRFYENGVTSLNLPPAGQVVGARASRTTHPRTLAGFGSFFSALFSRRFEVENRFQWDTKTEVVKRIADAGCGPLIGKSRSCAHTWQTEIRTQMHCGVCSQCIDRRFAVLAAEQEANDPADVYAVDLLTDPHEPGEQAMMVSAYLSLAERVRRMDEPEFAAQFPELARALPFLGLPPVAGVTRAHDLYRRHAQQVYRVIGNAIGEYLPQLRRQELPPTCLLRLAYDAAPAPEEPDAPPGNYFLRRGRGWVVRFGDGEGNVYLPELGIEYLWLLLSHPECEFTAAELYARVRQGNRSGRANADEAAVVAGDVRTGATGDRVLDEETVRSYRVRLTEIESALELLRTQNVEGGLETVEELERQREFIESELRRAHGLGGRPRTLGPNDRDKVRKRVNAAITRALKQIADDDEPLALHLKRPGLTLGHHIRYTPRNSVVWTTES